MPLINSSSPSAFQKNLKTELQAKPRKQALAIAFSVQNRAKKAAGGAATLPYSKVSSPEPVGMLHSSVAGRTDKLPVGIKSGGFVIPADTVSALGQGNSMAGANGLNKLLGMGPYGTSGGKSASVKRPRFADGGEVGGQPSVEAVVAGGEFIVPVEKVAELGGGDVSKGHDILDAMVMHVRKKNIKTLKKLPRPRKN